MLAFFSPFPSYLLFPFPSPSSDLYKQGADQYINTITGSLPADFFLDTAPSSPPHPPTPCLPPSLPLSLDESTGGEEGEWEGGGGEGEEEGVGGRGEEEEEGGGEEKERMRRGEVKKVFPLPWGDSFFLRHLWILSRGASPTPLLTLLSSFLQERKKEAGEMGDGEGGDGEGGKEGGNQGSEGERGGAKEGGEQEVGPRFALLFCAYRGSYSHILTLLFHYPSLSLSPLTFSSLVSQHLSRNLPYILGGPSLLGAICGRHTPRDSASYLKVLDEIHRKIPDVNGKAWHRDFSIRCIGGGEGGGGEGGKGEGGGGGEGEEGEWNVEGDAGANTCLHEAVAAGNVYATRWLLEKGLFCFFFVFVFLCFCVFVFVCLCFLFYYNP